jgi:hypothetical protein
MESIMPLPILYVLKAWLKVYFLPFGSRKIYVLHKNALMAQLPNLAAKSES